MDHDVQRAGRLERAAAALSRFLAGGGFAVFALGLLLFYQLFVAGMTFAPVRAGRLGAFVEDFRVRCFQYQPRTGVMEWGSVAVMLAEPVPLALMVLLVWKRPLREFVRSGPRHVVPIAAASLAIVAVLGAGLAGVGATEPATPDLPFPADRLRSDLPVPRFELQNQDGRPVSPGDFKGRVVLVTAIYSSCTTTCPRALGRLQALLGQLTPREREDLAIVAISLKPAADSREARDMIARSYGFDRTRFHFVGGDAGEVNALLDRLGVGRVVNEATGELVHSSLFMLVDRRGRIAYRLSLSEREQSWLPAAVRTLLAENPA
jgi:protein SCO1/2